MRVNLLSLRFLAAALVAGAALSPAAAVAQQKVGVNAAVNTDANGLPPGGVVRRLVIGQEVVHNERISTDARGQTQILFIDGSSISVGPNADLVIDEFVYDPATGTGKMTLTAVQGAMRFVGGKLSKQDNAVTLHLGTATIGVRGGVFVADVQPGGKTEIVFVYGKAVTVSGQSGCSQQLYRPGFAVDIDRPGGCPDAPHQAPPGTTAGILSRLDGRAGSNGGAKTVPTDAIVASSAVPNTVSNNVAASIQQATSNAPVAAAPPAPTVAPPQAPTNQVQVAASQSQAVIAAAAVAASQGQPVTPPAVTPPAPPAPPAPVAVTQIGGQFKDAFTTDTGFTNAATSNTPFTATIAYPAGTPLQNGTLSASSGSFGFTLSPLTAGATTQANAPATIAGVPTGNVASGPATMAADGNFFFANTVANAGDLVFFFGGTPVSQSFYAAQPTTQILAFNVLPDYALANGSQAQTIPFFPSFAGGTTANATVSPLYVATRPNAAFGNFNAISNPTGKAPFFLQASLGINGQGAGQSSVFGLATGSFITSSTFGTVVAGGPVRGAFMPGGTAPLTHISSGFTTVPDGSGNNLFGGNTLDGFVLDSNQSDVNGNFVTANANTFQVGVANSAVSYAFNQPVLAATLPSSVGTARSALNETGFFGGIMETGGRLQYGVTGAAAVLTNPSTSEVGAIFVGTDPFTSATTGIGSVTLPFGTLSGRNFARSAFIDNNIYAATESYTQPVQITTTGGATISYPTNGGGAATFPTLAMVTSGTVPGAADGLLPAGTSFCSCQYLQWGYWEGHIPAIGQGGPSNTGQSAFINTWVAGQPTVTMPTVGSGTYSGAAIGTVANNGATYLAAGGFSNTYNFGTNTGTVAISNFDGHNFSGTVAGSGSLYAGAIAGNGGNHQGTVIGSFYGPGAAETGGQFAVQAMSGPSYIASGIFAGKLTGPIH